MTPRRLRWVAVDPGGRHTGIVETGPGGNLAWWAVVHRLDGEHVHVYAEAVCAVLNNRAQVNDRYALEDVVPINPHVRDRPINPTPLNDTAWVAGAVASWMYNPVIVRPAGHGSWPLVTYPEALVTTGERRRKGWELRVGRSSQMRHARSAWDVLVAARLQTRMARPTPPEVRTRRYEEGAA